MKSDSTFFPASVREAVALNIADDQAARAERDRLVEAARPWREMSEQTLWAQVFGPTLPRSWMVWSNGHCPACKQPVVMYEWLMKPLELPWKTTCPRCGEVFPKNDFARFYQSGLDAAGVFDPDLADRSLLFNTEHPGADDPLRSFGVDDGQGYIDGDKKWRFIGAYLIYGQWKKVIVAGIRNLAAAYVVTGDIAYARRALIMLDRVADVFPGFDYATQGETYEKKGSDGYVSVWHDANAELAELIVAYDQVFDALGQDQQLVTWLSDKAREHNLANAKTTPAEIQRNIEERIFRDAIRQRPKIHTNFPGMHLLVITILAVLDWPDCKDMLYDYWSDLLKRTTAVDGLTGEKGLPSYSRYTIGLTAQTAALFLLCDDQFVQTMMRRVPNLTRTYRFHIDTWCADASFYPNEGDGTWFGARAENYLGLTLSPMDPDTGAAAKTPGARPSMDRFLLACARACGDVDFYRVIYKENADRAQGCVFDLTLPNMREASREVEKIIDTHGPNLALTSVNLRDWHLAILRSGEPGKQRAVWMDYDAGGYHSHLDAMNLGIFAHGMDLMPDAGYPPVQFGGWETDKVKWYYHTAAHNTVVIDGQPQCRDHTGLPIAGDTRLWLHSPSLKVMRMQAPQVYKAQQYVRTVLMVDIDADDFYVLDHFHVMGGRDHAKFMHANFSTMTTDGLTLEPCQDFGHGTLLRHFKKHSGHAPAGWAADWKIEDRFGDHAQPRDWHLRYTDFTRDAIAHTHEGWYVQGSMRDSVNEQWVPRIMVRRTAAGEADVLTSNFVGVIEPYVGTRKIASMRRLDDHDAQSAAAAMEITFTDGRRDVLVIGGTWQADDIKVYGDGALIRFDTQGRVTTLVALRARRVQVQDVLLDLDMYSKGVEIALDYSGASVRARSCSHDLSEHFGVTRLVVAGSDLTADLMPLRYA